MSRRFIPPDWREAIGPAFLLFAIAVNAYLLAPELLSMAPPVNDHVFHLQNLQRFADAIAQGRDPTDVWQPSVGQGFPVFHYYQHLPYAIPALLGLAIGDLVVAFKAINFALLCLFPASVYLSALRFGFPRLTAGTSALFASLLATDGLFGFDFASYMWAGHGLYTQLWGMVLLPPAVAQSFRAIRDGRGYLLAIVLVTITALAHLAYGYIALGSLVVFAILIPRRADLIVRGRRALLILIGFSAAAAYFIVPLLADSAYLNRSVWESDFKYDSFGAPTILGWLVSGQLFDFGRVPVLTVLAAIGLTISIRRWRDLRYRAVAALFLVWLVAYFGRPFWGQLLDLLPLSRDFYFHRLIGGVHLAGIFLVGIGMGVLIAWVLDQRRLRYLAVGAVGALLLAAPVMADRASHVARNNALMTASQQAYGVEDEALTALFDRLHSLRPGRVYAGLAGMWGRDYVVGGVPMYALLAEQGYDTLRMYHSWSVAGDVAALFDETRLDEYQLFNVRYIVAPTNREVPEFANRVATFGRHALYEVPTEGYFSVIDSTLRFAGTKRSFYPAASAWLNSAREDAADHPSVSFVDEPSGSQALPLDAAPALLAAAGAVNPPPAGRVENESVTADTLRASVRTDREAYVMARVTYHPNWHAAVDGRPVEATMVLPGYLAVPVGGGTHKVVLDYDPQPWRYLLVIVGLLGLGGAAFVDARRPDAVGAVRRLQRPVRFPTRGMAAPVMTGLRRYTATGWSAAAEGTRAAGSWVVRHPVATLAYVLIVGVTLRALLTPFYAYLPGDALDEYAWMRWMRSISEHGVLNVFRETQTDYVAYHWVLAGLAAIYDALGGAYRELPVQAGQYAAFPLLLHLLMKVPSLVFDVLLVIAGYWATNSLVRDLEGHPEQDSPRARLLGLAAAAVLAFHPVVAYTGAVWAQIDAAGAAAMLASIALIARGHSVAGWSVWMIGFLIKPQSFVVLPILVLVTLRTGKWTALAHGIAAAAAVGLVVLGPWILHGDLARILGIYARNFQGGLYSGGLSLAAWNGWWFFAPTAAPNAAEVGLWGIAPLTPRLIGLVLAALAGAVAVVYWLTRPRLKGALIAMAFLVFAFFMLPTGVHERYLYPFFALLLPVAAVDRRWRWLYAAASAAFLLNLLTVGPPIHDWSGRWDDSTLSFAIAGLNIFLFVTMATILVHDSRRWAVVAWSRCAPLLGRAHATYLGRRAFGRRAAHGSESLALSQNPEAVEGIVAPTSRLVRLAATPIAVVAGVLVGLPLLSGRWMSGHDSLVYIPRSVEFWEALRSGAWFPRWAADLGFGHGEPTFIFNPPLISYLTSGWHALGLSFVSSENMALFLILIVAAIGMYLLAAEFFGPRGGVVAAVAYVFAPYLLSRLFVSHALADFTAFAPLPFAFWGVYRFMSGGVFRFLVLGSVAVAVLLLSSSSVALMAVPALLGMVAYGSIAMSRLNVLWRGALCVGLGIGLASVFWIPSLIETEFVHIERRAGRLDYRDHFVAIWQLIHSPWGFGTSIPGSDDGMSFALGPMYIAAFGASALLLRRIRRASPTAAFAVGFFLSLALIATLMTTDLSRAIWDLVGLLHPLQFPFRFLQLVALSSAFLVGAAFVLLARRPTIANLAAGALIVVTIALGLPQARPLTHLGLTDADFTPQRIASEGVAASAREFEPIWVTHFPTDPIPVPELAFVGGAGNARLIASSPTRQSFSVYAAGDSLMQASTFFFPGWTVTVDGIERVLRPDMPTGLAEFYLEAGSHRVTLEFKDTGVRTAAWILSLASVVLLTAVGVTVHIRGRRLSRGSLLRGTVSVPATRSSSTSDTGYGARTPY